MATKPTAEPAPADPATDSPVAPEAPTPENTPKPGGGSFHWDAAQPGWVENTYA